MLFRNSRARVRGSTLYRKISLLSLLQVGRGSYLSSSNLISSGGASSLVGFHAQIANRTTESPTSKLGQLTGPEVEAKFWTMLKHPKYPTTDAKRPIRRRHSSGHARASIWYLFVSTAASTSPLPCRSRLTSYRSEIVHIRGWMSSCMISCVVKCIDKTFEGEGTRMRGSGGKKEPVTGKTRKLIRTSLKDVTETHITSV